ncbi:hypothetical protein PHLCEN_2v12107, partial [Hermanssonia centrifuga]
MVSNDTQLSRTVGPFPQTFSAGLICEILGYVRDSKSTLCACSLASRLWFGISRPYLFHSVTIDCEYVRRHFDDTENLTRDFRGRIRPFHAFLALLQGTPSICSSIQELCLKGSLFDFPEETLDRYLLCGILPLLTQLRLLRLENLELWREPGTYPLIGLTEESLMEFLCVIPSTVRTLHFESLDKVHGIRDGSSPSGPGGEIRLPTQLQIDTLHIISTSEPGITWLCQAFARSYQSLRNVRSVHATLEWISDPNLGEVLHAIGPNLHHLTFNVDYELDGFSKHSRQ